MENKPCAKHTEDRTRYVGVIHAPERIHGTHGFGMRRALVVLY